MKLLSSLLFLVAPFCFGQIPSHPAFDNDAVHEIKLTFAQPDFWEQLTTNFSENEDDVPYIEASFEWGEYKFERVGVRFKGNSSYRGATTNKKPFRIKLNEFVKGQKIAGIASYNLNNGWSDPSFVREKVAYELAAAAGLTVPRMNYAALYINGEYWGAYFLGEVVNGDFLDSRFPADKNGNLYKGNIGAAFEDKGDAADEYKAVFEKKSNESADDWTDLIHLTAVLNRTPKEELADKIASVLDVDSFLTAMALDNFTLNLDNYVGMAQNFYVYHRASDDRFVWLPWDPSLAFGALGLGVTTEQMKTLPLEWTVASTQAGGAFPGGGIGPAPPGGPGGPTGPGGPGGQGGAGFARGSNARPLATKIWELPRFQERYNQIYCGLIKNVYFQDAVSARMQQLRDLIRPWLEMDPNRLNTMEQFEAALTEDSVGAAPGRPGGGFPGGGQPGGMGGFGGMSSPGIEPLMKARLAFVESQLGSRTNACQ